MEEKTKNRHKETFRRLTGRQRFFWAFPPITILLVLFIAAFGIGFVFFAEMVSRQDVPENPPVADGILVLTGGTMRLETGFILLSEKKAKRLLISGVNPGTKRAALIAATGHDTSLFDCCVDLGRMAADTVGNARESANWMQSHHFKTVYVVTNDYHMPRSLVELHRVMPEVTLIPYPVNTDTVENQSWWKWGERQRLILLEYIKFIGTHILGIFNAR